MTSNLVATATFALALPFAIAAVAANPHPAAAAPSDLDRMAAEHQHDAPAPTPAATTEPSRPVVASEISFGMIYGRPLHGYLAQLAGPGGKLPAPEAAKAPGIIVIHEWWGLNDNIRAMTRRLAGEGYNALAVDLYGGKVATTPDEARKLAGAAMADVDGGMAILRAANDFLRKEGAPRVGVIGWCFGGGWSLNAAIDLPLDAAVMYYGQPVKERKRLAKLHAPLLGFFGADDRSIPPAAVHEMEGTLKQLGKSVEVHVYDGAGHAFANPSGTGYRPAAAEDAWKRTVDFFNQKLKGS
jgi:carboxymethylenebutenolidase